MAGYVLPTEAEEQQVLRSCLSGEEGSLDLLYRRYGPPLIAFCRSRLGDSGDAEDAAHETILKAHRALPGFRQDARLWPWIATIAANLCIDMHRSRQRLDPEADLVASLGPDVDDVVNRRLRAEIVKTALGELPEHYRTPLLLREFMGWSYDEIAAFSDKTTGSVRSTLMRARRALQAQIEHVARQTGQWPLPSLVMGDTWRRARANFRSWRNSAARTACHAADILLRAPVVLAACAPGFPTAASAAPAHTAAPPPVVRPAHAQAAVLVQVGGIGTSLRVPVVPDGAHSDEGSHEANAEARVDFSEARTGVGWSVNVPCGSSSFVYGTVCTVGSYAGGVSESPSNGLPPSLPPGATP
jgi:RNA polymerase sigma-70 factor, ECF subfamily